MSRDALYTYVLTQAFSPALRPPSSLLPGADDPSKRLSGHNDNDGMDGDALTDEDDEAGLVAEYLCCGTSRGNLHIFDATQISEADDSDQLERHKLRPLFTVRPLGNGAVFAATNHGEEWLCVTGEDGVVAGYTWTGLLDMKRHAQPRFELRPDLSHKQVPMLSMCSLENHLMTGRNDGSVLMFDVEAGKASRCFREHDASTDVLNVKRGDTANEFYSTGEDGRVVFYDVRQPKATHKARIDHSAGVERKPLGKRLHALCVDGDWLYTGGGPNLVSFSIKTMTVCTVFEQSNFVTSCLVDVVDSSLVVGSVANQNKAPVLVKFDMDGGSATSIPISLSGVFSLSTNSKGDDRLVTIGGTSPVIPVFSGSNFQIGNFIAVP